MIAIALDAEATLPFIEFQTLRTIQTKVNASERTGVSHRTTVPFSVETEYVVTTQTGSMTGAGTDSKVFISFNGDKNKIAKHPLVKPESGKNPFEKKSKDVFKFNETDVGKVRH